MTLKINLSVPHMSGNEEKYIRKAFDDNFVTPLGPNVDNFESNISSYLGENVYTVAMSSGTAAIHIALILCGVERGEDVFCSSSTFVASANPVKYVGANPVFIDCDKKTWNLCPDSLLKAIAYYKDNNLSMPKVLVLVDSLGNPADFEKIESICKDEGIEIISDAAKSFGSTYKGRKCGTFGKFGILSFNGNKIITTSGGGALITHSKHEAQRALHLITQAKECAPYYQHAELGYNYRMSNVSAGIGLAQLEVLEDRVSKRREIFNYYKNELKNYPVSFLDLDSSIRSNCWLSSLYIENENVEIEKLRSHLYANGIDSRRYWKPMHLQPLFEGSLFFKAEDIAISEDLFEHVLCLPSSSSLTEDELAYVCDKIKSFFDNL